MDKKIISEKLKNEILSMVKKAENTEELYHSILDLFDDSEILYS